MASIVRGLYRGPGSAFVTDDSMGFDIPEAEYREARYIPKYDDLPTRETYKARHLRRPKGGQHT